MRNTLVNALSPHESDVLYLSEIMGKQQFGDQPGLQDVAEFATAAGMVVQQDLTNIARTYKPERQTFIADEIAPLVSVQTEAGRYSAFGKEGYDIDVSDQLADEGEAGTLVWAGTKVSFQIDPRGLQTFVSDRISGLRGPVAAAQMATKLLTTALMRRQEIRVRNLADATSNTIANGTDWDTSSAVHTDVAAAQAVMQAALGQRGTHLAIGDHIADEMVANANIVSNIAAANAAQDGRKWLGQITSDGLAPNNPWGLKMLLPNAFYTSTAPGLARVMARIWGDDGYLVHVDRETETSTWAVQLNFLNPTVVSWRDLSKGIGGTWYKVFFQRKAIEVTPEAICKLPDLT